MSSTNKSGNNLKTVFAVVIIPLSYIICLLVFNFVFGNPANFMENNSDNNPLPGNYLGIIYKGGFVVPILMTCVLVVIIFSLERFLTINAAKGKGSINGFVSRIRGMLARGDFHAASVESDRQQGSIANVVKSGLVMYKKMEEDKTLDKERKILAIQKEIEESTTLELPMLSKNLVIISTIASISTLIGLFGTVLGMVRAFAALAQAGAPDAVALSTGISEALINTALGILGSTIAIVMYNYFMNKIDALTYGIDEAGYSIVQTFAEKHA